MSNPNHTDDSSLPLMCDIREATLLWTLVDRGYDLGPGTREMQISLRNKISELIRALRGTP